MLSRKREKFGWLKTIDFLSSGEVYLASDIFVQKNIYEVATTAKIERISPADSFMR